MFVLHLQLLYQLVVLILGGTEGLTALLLKFGSHVGEVVTRSRAILRTYATCFLQRRFETRSLALYLQCQIFPKGNECLDVSMFHAGGVLLSFVPAHVEALEQLSDAFQHFVEALLLLKSRAV